MTGDWDAELLREQREALERENARLRAELEQRCGAYADRFHADRQRHLAEQRAEEAETRLAAVIAALDSRAAQSSNGAVVRKIVRAAATGEG